MLHVFNRQYHMNRAFQMCLQGNRVYVTYYCRFRYFLAIFFGRLELNQDTAWICMVESLYYFPICHWFC